MIRAGERETDVDIGEALVRTRVELRRRVRDVEVGIEVDGVHVAEMLRVSAPAGPEGPVGRVVRERSETTGDVVRGDHAAGVRVGPEQVRRALVAGEPQILAVECDAHTDTRG